MDATGLVLWCAAALAVTALVGVLFRWVLRRFGCECHLCGERMEPYERLSPEEQHEISRYYRECEHRMPDARAVFACRRCGAVYDDFCGDRLAAEGSWRSICKMCHSPTVGYMGGPALRGELPRLRQRYPDLARRCECLRCARRPSEDADCVLCDAEPKVLGCRSCLTLYEWRAREGSRFRFLAPITTRSVLPEAPGGPAY